MLVHIVKPGLRAEAEQTVQAAMTVVRDLEKHYTGLADAPETVVLVMDASERWQDVVRHVAEALKESRAIRVETAA